MEVRSPDPTNAWQPDDRLWVPISIIDRATVLDNLEVSRGRNEPIHVATHEEHCELLVAFLCAYLERIGYPRELNTIEGASDNADLYATKRILAKIVSLPLVEGKFARQAKADLLNEANMVSESNLPLASYLAKEVQAMRGLGFLLETACRYPIFIESTVDTAGRLTFSYEYDAFHHEEWFLERGEEANLSRGMRFLRHVRQVAGLRPANNVFFLGRAPALCRNFSFHMEAPPGFYRYDNAFFRAKRASIAGPGLNDFDPAKATLLLPKAGELVVPDPADEARTDQNLPYAHMYLGGCRRHKTRLFASIRFFERPPGVLGIAKYSSLVSLFVLVVFLLAFRRVASSTDPALAAVPAILIGLPGVYTLWLAPRMPTNAITSRPLTAVLAFVATGAISLGAALVVTLTASLHGVVIWHSAPFSFSMTATGEVLFIALTAGQAILYGFIRMRDRFAREDFERGELRTTRPERMMFALLRQRARNKDRHLGKVI
jgi:hypothetical protein